MTFAPPTPDKDGGCPTCGQPFTIAAISDALSAERARVIELKAALTGSNDLVADIHDRALEELKADKELGHDPYDMPDDCEVLVTVKMGELRKAQQTASAALLKAQGQQTEDSE
jgi:putative SOS response-associated peptidase YedK